MLRPSVFHLKFTHLIEGLFGAWNPVRTSESLTGYKEILPISTCCIPLCSSIFSWCQLDMSGEFVGENIKSAFASWMNRGKRQMRCTTIVSLPNTWTLSQDGLMRLTSNKKTSGAHITRNIVTSVSVGANSDSRRHMSYVNMVSIQLTCTVVSWLPGNRLQQSTSDQVSVTNNYI